MPDSVRSSVHTEQNLQLERARIKKKNFTLQQSLDSYSRKRKANKDKNKKRGTEKSGAKKGSSQEKK
jgi:FtsZ-binding cell division protein ZapB